MKRSYFRSWFLMERNCAALNGRLSSASAWLSLLHAVQRQNCSYVRSESLIVIVKIRSNVWSRNVIVRHRVTVNDRMRSDSAQQMNLHDNHFYTLVAAFGSETCQCVIMSLCMADCNQALHGNFCSYKSLLCLGSSIVQLFLH